VTPHSIPDQAAGFLDRRIGKHISGRRSAPAAIRQTANVTGAGHNRRLSQHRRTIDHVSIRPFVARTMTVRGGDFMPSPKPPLRNDQIDLLDGGGERLRGGDARRGPCASAACDADR
jgi:hypothetical protein